MAHDYIPIPIKIELVNAGISDENINEINEAFYDQRLFWMSSDCDEYVGVPG